MLNAISFHFSALLYVFIFHLKGRGFLFIYNVFFAVSCNEELINVSAKCYRSMRKNEPPHILQVSTKRSDASLAGQCSCVAGVGGYCHHVIGLLYYLALLRQLGHQTLPDELTCTSMKQRWSVPRGKKLQQQEIQNVLVKRPQLGATYSRFIKSNLYCPSSMYLTLTKEHFANCQPQPLFATVLPSESQLPNIPFVQSKFGNVPKSCVLSYQQNMSSVYIINDFTCTAFPDLPLPTAEERFDNNVSVCLNSTQQASLGSLSISMPSRLNKYNR